jgi:WD40 repeat protein
MCGALIRGQDSVVPEIPLMSQRVIKAHASEILDARYSPNGRIIATASNDKTVVIWNTTVQSPVMIRTLPHSHWVFAVAWHPDGVELLTASLDGVRRWNITVCD